MDKYDLHHSETTEQLGKNRAAQNEKGNYTEFILISASIIFDFFIYLSIKVQCILGSLV